MWRIAEASVAFFFLPSFLSLDPTVSFDLLFIYLYLILFYFGSPYIVLLGATARHVQRIYTPVFTILYCTYLLVRLFDHFYLHLTQQRWLFLFKRIFLLSDPAVHNG